MKHIVEAAIGIFGRYQFKEWINKHSSKLNLNVKSIDEARHEIYRVINNLQNEENTNNTITSTNAY